MPQVILITILAVVVLALIFSSKTRETTTGIGRAVLDQTVRKRANKEKVLEFIRTHSTGSGQEGVSNEEIREHLGVSARTAVRYLDALEKEGKIEQIGKTGRGATYRSK